MNITLDPFGVVDETTFSLRHSDMVDASAPTLESALKEALLCFAKCDSKKISIVTVRYSPKGKPFAHKLLMELHASDALTELLGEEGVLLPSTTGARTRWPTVASDDTTANPG